MTDLREGTDDGANVAEETLVDTATLNADQQIALTLMEEICASSGMEARAVVRSLQKPYMNIELLGESIRATWGRVGQGLDALQFLCNTILSRRVSTDVRLLLDAEGYRERRAESLRIRALELAEEVKSRNQEAELEPLPAHERRIIHAVLADDPDISTYSEGDEPARRVVISPRR
jgi:spoIIIJ-associated protein